MTELVKVKYVGRKPVAFDNVAGSGKSWQGQGAVQEVTPKQAKKLTSYPDSWALVDLGDAVTVQSLPDATTTVETLDGEIVDVPDAGLLTKPLERMSKVELAGFASLKFGKDLDQGLSKKAMVDQIEEWQQTIPEVRN